MRKTLIGAAGAVTALALAIAGCSGSPAPSGSAPASSDAASSAPATPQTVTFLTHWGPDQVKMLEDAAAKYTKANPNVTVKVQAVPFANLLTTLRTQASSPDGPTIAGIYDAWLPELARDGIAAEAPSDIAGEVTSNWPAGVVKAASQDGTVLGIPNEIDLYQLNYNQELFDKAGVKAAPKTWDELVDAATKIKALGNGVQGVGFITNWSSGVDHPFLSLLASNGGSFLNEEGTAAALTSPQAAETFQLYEKLVKQGLTDISMSPANANTTGPFLDNFAGGKTGMIIMANWWQSALEQAMGDKFSNVKTAPIPVGPSGKSSSSISYSWMTVVNANADAEKQAAAWGFLNWLNGPDSGASGTSAMGEILLSMGIIPSRNSDIAANSAKLGTPFLKSYVDAAASATPFPTVIGGTAAADALQKDIEALLNGQVDAAAAATQATSDVDSALKAAQ